MARCSSWPNSCPKRKQRTMQTSVSRLRCQKMTLWCYLEDFTMLGRSWHEIFFHTLELVSLLLKLGLEIHYPKLVLTPTPSFVWIGLKLNFLLGQ